MRSKGEIDIRFRAIWSFEIAVRQQYYNFFAWRVEVRISSEVPRFLLTLFQTNKSGNQKQTPALFDHITLIILHAQWDKRTVSYYTMYNPFARSSSAESILYMNTMVLEDMYYKIQNPEE